MSFRAEDLDAIAEDLSEKCLDDEPEGRGMMDLEHCFHDSTADPFVRFPQAES